MLRLPALLAALLVTTFLLEVPAAAQPVEVASGEDLAVWQAVEHRRLTGVDRVAAYQAFVEAFASSPLAVAAWGRLHEVGADRPWTEDAVKLPVLLDVQARWEASRAALARPVAPARVVSIAFDDDGIVQR